jgi:hypothetical protein
VQAAGLDYPTVALAELTVAAGANIGNPDALLALAPGYFNSETDKFELESLGIFGEV